MTAASQSRRSFLRSSILPSSSFSFGCLQLRVRAIDRPLMLTETRAIKRDDDDAVKIPTAARRRPPYITNDPSETTAAAAVAAIVAYSRDCETRGDEVLSRAFAPRR